MPHVRPRGQMRQHSIEVSFTDRLYEWASLIFEVWTFLHQASGLRTGDRWIEEVNKTTALNKVEAEQSVEKSHRIRQLSTRQGMIWDLKPGEIENEKKNVFRVNLSSSFP